MRLWLRILKVGRLAIINYSRCRSTHVQQWYQVSTKESENSASSHGHVSGPWLPASQYSASSRSEGDPGGHRDLWSYRYCACSKEPNTMALLEVFWCCSEAFSTASTRRVVRSSSSDGVKTISCHLEALFNNSSIKTPTLDLEAKTGRSVVRRRNQDGPGTTCWVPSLFFHFYK